MPRSPTRKSNILDLIFSPDDFKNCIDITDSVILDHRIFTAKTLIPISQSFPPCQTMNYTCNTFELLDFRKTDWSGLCTSIKSVNWSYYCMIVFLQNISQLLVRLYVISALYMYSLSVPKITVSQFHGARIILMRKRSKLLKIYPLTPSIQSKLASI